MAIEPIEISLIRHLRGLSGMSQEDLVFELRTRHPELFGSLSASSLRRWEAGDLPKYGKLRAILDVLNPLVPEEERVELPSLSIVAPAEPAAGASSVSSAPGDLASGGYLSRRAVLRSHTLSPLPVASGF